VRYDASPAPFDLFQRIALNVWAGCACGFQITRNRINAAMNESVTKSAAFLASNKPGHTSAAPLMRLAPFLGAAGLGAAKPPEGGNRKPSGADAGNTPE
jgi:hypothetical protein